jgi:hypothetical protein
MTSREELRAWIRRHRVCWETLAHRERSRGGFPSVGFDVYLTATCIGAGPWDPGGERCQALFMRLQELAQRAVPAVCAEAIRFEGFEPAFHLRPEARFAPEVHLVIEVRHRRHGYFEPIDAAEQQCVRSLEAELARWGVQRGRWRDHPCENPTGEAGRNRTFCATTRP